MKEIFFKHVMLIVNTIVVACYIWASIGYVFEVKGSASGLAFSLAVLFLMHYIIDRDRLLKYMREFDDHLKDLVSAFEMASSERTKAHAINFKYQVSQRRVTECEHEVRRLKRALKEERKR